jgi:ATP-binding protein involved in chromosome partitioning
MSYLELADGTRMDIFGSGGGKRLAEESGVPFIGSIPLDAKVRAGGDIGLPVVISDPDLPVSKALIEISEDIAAKISVAALNTNNFIPISMVG